MNWPGRKFGAIIGQHKSLSLGGGDGGGGGRGGDDLNWGQIVKQHC